MKIIVSYPCSFLEIEIYQKILEIVKESYENNYSLLIKEAARDTFLIAYKEILKQILKDNADINSN